MLRNCATASGSSAWLSSSEDLLDHLVEDAGAAWLRTFLHGCSFLNDEVVRLAYCTGSEE